MIKEGYKKCSKCGEIKPFEEFYKDKSHKDGYRSICKKCIKENNKKWYEENKEYMKEYNKKWYEENKENWNKYVKKYREENREYLKEINKKYYEENRDSRNEYNKKYREENREYWNEYNKKYHKEYRKNLKDSYIKALIHRQTKAPFSEITEEMIQLKRALLLVHRKLKGA